MNCLHEVVAIGKYFQNNLCVWKKNLILNDLGDRHNDRQLYMGWWVCQMMCEAYSSIFKCK